MNVIQNVFFKKHRNNPWARTKPIFPPSSSLVLHITLICRIKWTSFSTKCSEKLQRDANLNIAFQLSVWAPSLKNSPTVPERRKTQGKQAVKKERVQQSHGKRAAELQLCPFHCYHTLLQWCLFLLSVVLEQNGCVCAPDSEVQQTLRSRASWHCCWAKGSYLPALSAVCFCSCILSYLVSNIYEATV